MSRRSGVPEWFKWTVSLIAFALLTFLFAVDVIRVRSARAAEAMSSTSITLDPSSGRYVRMTSLATLPNGCSVSRAELSPSGNPEFQSAIVLNVATCPRLDTNTTQMTGKNSQTTIVVPQEQQ